MVRCSCMLLAVALSLSAAPPPQAPPPTVGAPSLTSQEVARLLDQAELAVQGGQFVQAMSPLVRVQNDVSRQLTERAPTAPAPRLSVRTASGVVRALQDARTAHEAGDWNQARQHLRAALTGLASLESKVSPALRYESALREVEAADRFNTVALLRAARAALEVGRHGEAVQFADRYNERARELFRPAIAGDLIHQGHTVAGLAALRLNDLLEARRRLIESAAVQSGALVQAMGPSMALARALLAHGERAVVLDYLDRCTKLTWGEGAVLLPEWRRQIEQGQTPDFGKHALWM